MDILYEVSCSLSHLALPRIGHHNAVYNVFGYLAKHIKSVLVLDDIEIETPESDFVREDWSETIYGPEKEELPPKMPMPRGRGMKIFVFC